MRYLFYLTFSYSFSILRPLEKVIIKSGGSVAWFIPKGSEAEDFILGSDNRLLTVDQVKAFSAHATFVPGNVVPDFFPGIKVQIFHGFDSGKKNVFKLKGFFDLYCTQGPIMTNGFRNISDNTCEIVETGWTKLDPLFINHSDVKKYKTDLPMILYAPTFSPKLRSTYDLFKKIKDLAFKDKWSWLIKLHPKAKKEEIDMYKSIKSSNLRFVETEDIIPLLQASDVLLSDTSSILLEFSLLNKATISYKNRRPESWMINFSDSEDLEKSIEKALSSNSEYKNIISEHNKLVHPYTDGKSSERVLLETEKLIEKGIDHLNSKPFNLFRKLKIRKELKYYKWK